MVINCKEISDIKRNNLKEAVLSTGIVPGLAVILVGGNPASRIYVKNKRNACANVGFYSDIFCLDEQSTTEDIVAIIQKLSCRKDIHGIMVQFPLPPHIDANRVISSIPVEKDVDCLTPTNMGNLIFGNAAFTPCTPGGILSLLKHIGYRLSHSTCVILGRSNIVGKPLAAMLTAQDATVTICHSKTKDVSHYTKQADILISAVGKAGFITADMVSSNTVVIDVGINRTDDGKPVGDVCFTEVEKVARAVTPVPGGVGAMTVTTLLENTYKAALLQMNKKKGNE